MEGVPELDGHRRKSLDPLRDARVERLGVRGDGSRDEERKEPVQSA
jgi:hypothetical protein